MQQISVTSNSLDTIDFIPTVIIGFYKSSEKTLFLHDYEILKKRFPNADIIGSSSKDNISNICPYVEPYQTLPCVYLCLDMQKDSYCFELFEEEEKINLSKIEKERKYQTILLSTFSSLKLEEMLETLPSIIGTQRIFGAVASSASHKNSLEIFYNGTFYKQHVLLWLIDEENYTVDGMSMHLFRPAGLPLQITKCQRKTVYELDNKPALKVIESLAGELDESLVKNFAYPLFVKKDNIEWESTPLSSLYSVDRKENSIYLYRDMSQSAYIKMGIMVNRQTQLRRLRDYYSVSPRQSAALLFFCMGIVENLDMMEYIYLEDIKRHLDSTFIGFHSYGEIGYPATFNMYNHTVLHNQTMTIVFISKKEKS